MVVEVAVAGRVEVMRVERGAVVVVEKEEETEAGEMVAVQMLRRLGPPQNWEELPAQSMELQVWLRVEPKPRLGPQ